MTAGQSNPEFTDYYALLGIAHTADLLQIRQAFLAKAKLHHPDTGGSTETMLQLNKAYRTLSNEMSKTLYDQKHSFAVPGTSMSDYAYADGRQINDVNDMTDNEIDSFLDELLNEHRNKPVAPKKTAKQKIKRMFGF